MTLSAATAKTAKMERMVAMDTMAEMDVGGLVVRRGVMGRKVKGVVMERRAK